MFPLATRTPGAEDEQASEDLLTLVCMASELVGEATQHKTFATFQRYNKPSEEALKAVVLADAPTVMVQGKAK